MMIDRSIALIFVCSVAGLLAAPALAQGSAAGGEDEDPTKTVVFNLRYQHAELLNGGSADLFLIRRDVAIVGGNRPPNHKVVLLRFDLPVGTVEAGGQRHSGLGDLYAQAVHIHPLNRRFSLGSGTGVFLPTAGDDLLGFGKWQIAPLVVPVWFLTRPRGMFFCKVQDQFSVAGDDNRPDLHWLLVTPTLLWRFRPPAWLLVDSEAQVDWRLDQTSYKSGVLFGTTFSHRRGAWIKLEVPWGENRLGEWTVKASFTLRGRR